jgi:hypothetical protein
MRSWQLCAIVWASDCVLGEYVVRSNVVLVATMTSCTTACPQVTFTCLQYPTLFIAAAFQILVQALTNGMLQVVMMPLTHPTPPGSLPSEQFAGGMGACCLL